MDAPPETLTIEPLVKEHDPALGEQSDDGADDFAEALDAGEDADAPEPEGADELAPAGGDELTLAGGDELTLAGGDELTLAGGDELTLADGDELTLADAASELGMQAGNELSDDELLQSVTALVFASPDPLSEKRLETLLEGPEPARISAALSALAARLDQSGLPLELRKLAGGFVILSAPRMGPTIQRLFKARKAERISSAALETLSVVAYRQPVTKAEIEAIRGVQSAPILRTLIDRGLVRIAGRADVPGHPLQYGTTREFLDRFGLGHIDELPRDSELAKD